MPDPVRIWVTVVYAEPERAFRVECELSAGATVAHAIAKSGIRGACPDVEIDPDRIGIFARTATLSTVLRDGDRVEIYRPLKLDPKEARRRRTRRTEQPTRR